MGYLTIHGYLLTYNEYKEHIQAYRKNGLKQFLSIHDRHKDRFIEDKDLHWGEEIEYTVFYFNNQEKFQLFGDAYNHITQFNTDH
mmetsp:Transcript_21171/g.20324  ORF Transcript_21171/g.20324 Transcript_21171/m.20324 type:complete len:85 (-) Transcript_21171:1738-1992(-)